MKPYISTGSIQATMTAVSATTKHPEECVKFLELINTNKKLYNLIVYGIEGKHYTVNDDTTIHVNEDAGYAPRCGWKFGNQLNALIEEGNDLNVWKETEELNNSATVSPAVGITYFDDYVTNEIAQVNTVMSKYPFSKGYVEINDDAVNKYKKEVEKAGSHTVYKEYKKQLDEFKANSK